MNFTIMVKKGTYVCEIIKRKFFLFLEHQENYPKGLIFYPPVEKGEVSIPVPRVVWIFPFFHGCPFFTLSGISQKVQKKKRP